MRCFYATFFAFCSFFFLAASKTSACGYDWVGECSSSVHLRINGTLDSFGIADCPSGLRFQNQYLGTLKTLSLANAKAVTWESCINNVSGVSLKYRLFEQGGGAGAFQTLDLNQDFFTLDGPYTTRYRSNASNIDLTNGLTVGKTYVLEVYFLAAVDTIGDDFIPETVLLKNNGGQNYRLTFTYGGPNANPFVVIPTLIQNPNCHGESNGAIGVSVWGDHTGLFYNWSNVNLNFYQQSGIPAGTYTVTVTGANYAESQTIVLTQPDILGAQFSNIQPVSCGGGQGQATVAGTGGTAPYHYVWQTGQTTASASFPNAGSYSVTVYDAHNCFVTRILTISGSGFIQQSQTAELCAGSTLMVGPILITVPGVYQTLLPGNGGCDTLLTLTVNGIDPAALLDSLPNNVLITCANPAVNLCSTFSPAAQYQWSKDGIPATQTPCLSATAGGVYQLTISIGACQASQNIAAEEHLLDPTGKILGTAVLDCSQMIPSLLLHAQTAAENPTFLWTKDGQTLSTSDTCWFTITEFVNIPPGGIVPVLPELLVTDAYGCSGYATGQVTFSMDTSSPILDFNVTDASASNGADGSAALLIFGASPPYDILWSNGATTMQINNLTPGSYCVTVTGQNGCATSDCATVSVLSAVNDENDAQLLVFPNPTSPGNWFDLNLPADFEGQTIRIEWIDFAGRVVMLDKTTSGGGNIRIQCPGTLSEGVYGLQILSEKRQICGKISLKM